MRIVEINHAVYLLKLGKLYEIVGNRMIRVKEVK